ncbi:MAG TPA: ABC transporter ATP-binding protein [Candidatus Saccharimonadales bacterium]|nr:ABC transporter ATP-binding protein [Candidatus Saccharimonadales bacterium]
MNERSSIVAKDLVVRRGPTSILNALSFSVERGAITGLVGPSGSGKTTLIRSIVGVQKLTSGTLTVLGEAAGSRLLRRRIGYMAQGMAVYVDLTVEQNLRYFGTLLGASRAQCEAIIEQVHLDDRRHYQVKHLSGGQQARVSLGIALLGDPDLLMLDEPTVGLDPILRRELWALFDELAADGKTLVISSHVMDETERCDNLLLLRQGELLWSDTREKLLSSMGAVTVEDAFVAAVSARGGI